MKQNDYFDLREWLLLSEIEKVNFLNYAKLLGFDEQYVNVYNSSVVDETLIVLDEDTLLITDHSDPNLGTLITYDDLIRMSELGSFA